MSEYTEQAERFLKAHNLEFRTVLVGDDCPEFCEDAEKDTQRQTEYKIGVYPRKTHIHGKHYRCTISGKDRGHVSFDSGTVTRMRSIIISAFTNSQLTAALRTG